MTKLASALILLAALACSRLQAQTLVDGQSLQIRPSGSSSQVSAGSLSGAIGYSNNVTAGSSLAVGSYNNISLATGMALGNSNTVIGWNTIMIGQSNFSVNNGSSAPSNSMLLGNYNSFGAFVNSSIVSGMYNAIGSSSYLYGTAAFGTGLANNTWNYSCIVGKYNSTTTVLQGSPLFVVGTGTGPAARTNGLEVYDDGRVIVPKRQGDILMGEFGN